MLRCVSTTPSQTFHHHRFSPFTLHYPSLSQPFPPATTILLSVYICEFQSQSVHVVYTLSRKGIHRLSPQLRQELPEIILDSPLYLSSSNTMPGTQKGLCDVCQRINGQRKGWQPYHLPSSL